MYSNGPKIVTNGLVLCLDAGNTKSYPGSGTFWRDISRNGINGTLINGPIFSSTNNGSIVFDGFDDYALCTGTIVTSAATFLIWVYRNGSQGSYTGMLFSRGTGANVTGINIVPNSGSQLGYHWNDNSNTYNWLSGISMPDLQWCLCAVSVSPTSATVYVCQQSGITSAVNNVSHASTTLDDIRVGVDRYQAGRWFRGNIAVAQIYNRALSRDEILQNYNATKGRFKL